MKHSLVSGASNGSGYGFSGDQKAFEENEMGLEEYAKHASVKVSRIELA